MHRGASLPCFTAVSETPTTEELVAVDRRGSIEFMLRQGIGTHRLPLARGVDRPQKGVARRTVQPRRVSVSAWASCDARAIQLEDSRTDAFSFGCTSRHFRSWSPGRGSGTPSERRSVIGCVSRLSDDALRPSSARWSSSGCAPSTLPVGERASSRIRFLAGRLARALSLTRRPEARIVFAA